MSDHIWPWSQGRKIGLAENYLVGGERRLSCREICDLIYWTTLEPVTSRFVPVGGVGFVPPDE